jgi:hypothetical protein
MPANTNPQSADRPDQKKPPQRARSETDFEPLLNDAQAVRIPTMWMVDSSAMWMVIPGMWIKSERSDAGIAIMPDTFEINQGARVIFSIVSFPFLSLFRLSVAFVKPVLRACSFSSSLCLSRFFPGKYRARIA